LASPSSSTSSARRSPAASGEIVPDDQRGSVVLVDYGCAQGRVSNPLIRSAIERLRRAYPEVPVQVYHNAGHHAGRTLTTVELLFLG
jgi:hypothetical protein